MIDIDTFDIILFELWWWMDERMKRILLGVETHVNRCTRSEKNI